MNVGIIFCFFLFSNSIFGQESSTLIGIWVEEEVSELPEPFSNGAVSAFSKDGGEYVYVFGGIDSTLSSNGIHRRCYRVNTIEKNDLLRLPDIPDSLGKIALSASRIGDKAYLIGGYHVFPNGKEKSSKLVHEFDLIGDTFTSKKIVLPLAIDDHVQGVWKDSLIYIINGWSDSTNVRYTQIYNPKSNTWNIGTAMYNSMTPAFGAAGTISNNTIYIQGGARSDQNFFPASQYYFRGEINDTDATKIVWSAHQVADSLTSYRSAISFDLNNYPFVFGGSKRSYNYNGVDYRLNTLVKPLNGTISLLPDKAIYNKSRNGQNNDIDIPMDIRDWANMVISGFAYNEDSLSQGSAIFIAGGINKSGKVSKKIIRRSHHWVLNTKEVNHKKNYQLYPNPSEDFVTVSSSNLPSSTADIYNLSGAKVKSVRLSNQNTKIDLSDLEVGMYLFINQELKIKELLIKK